MTHSVDRVKLSNGSEGLLVNIPGATVMAFEFSFRAGDYLVERSKWETPHLMEHILLGANELFPKSRDFQAEIEKNGAYSNATTGSYDVSYEAECADFEWDRIFGLLLTSLSKPLFLQEEFDAEFGNVREELSSRSNNHFRHLNLALRQKYGFYSLTDQERLKLMDNVKLEDVKAHYEKTHRTPNMRFVIAGNITKSRREIIEKMLGSIELPNTGNRTPLPKETPKSLSKALYIDNPTVDNLYFYLDTYIRRTITDAESYALMIANVFLTETLHSRIYGQAREKGLVYSVSSNYSKFLDSANFWIGAQVMPKNAEQLFSIIKSELQNIKLGHFSDDELKAAKLYLLGRYQRSAQTVASTANLYSGRYFYDQVVEDFEAVPGNIQAVSRDQVEAVMNTLFSENIGGFGLLGSCGDDFAQKAQKTFSGLWQEA